MRVAGVSTRAAAHSAARAGLDVTAIDAFADRDQHPGVSAHAVQHEPSRPFTARALTAAARHAPADAVVYLSPLDNHPDAVRAIARGRRLWGNPPEVLRRVREPRQVAAALRDAGLRAPIVASASDLPEAGRSWLRKPRASGGGRGIAPWVPGMRVDRMSYLQERIDGPSGSIVFVAAGRHALPLALSYQLVGEEAFGADGFRYCGSILPPDGDSLLGRAGAASAQACRMAEALAASFGLVGVNGIDFIAGAEGPVAIEVNPRWCASMELVDRGSATPVFAWHMAACTAGAWPAVAFEPPARAEAVGKAVVFARADTIAGNTDAWLADATVGDVPRPGTPIGAGSPVCSVFATGRDVARCRSALVRRAEEIYAVLDRWGRCG